MPAGGASAVKLEGPKLQLRKESKGVPPHTVVYGYLASCPGDGKG